VRNLRIANRHAIADARDGRRWYSEGCRCQKCKRLRAQLRQASISERRKNLRIVRAGTRNVPPPSTGDLQDTQSMFGISAPWAE
jgi:hypothetical protein